MLTLEIVEKKLKKVEKIGLKCLDEKGFIKESESLSGSFGKICAEAVLSFNPLVITMTDGMHAHIENRMVGIHKNHLHFFDFDDSVPLYSNGWAAEVGDKIKHIEINYVKEVIRIDPSTRQVWFKRGGFEWFEDMRNYQEV